MPSDPIRFLDRSGRTAADEALTRGCDLLAAVALTAQGRAAHDTPANARALAELMGQALDQLLDARALYRRRGGR